MSSKNSLFHFIDDDPVIRSFMLEVVPDLGHEIKVFASASSYLDFVGKPHFRLPAAVLTDIQMPEMDGFALAATLRKRFPCLKIALVTGYPSYEAQANQMECHFMCKPFFPADLGALLGALSCCRYSEEQPDVLDRSNPRCDMGLKHDCPFKR